MALRIQISPLSVQVWGLRVLGIAIFLLSMAASGIPAMAFTLAWATNGLSFLAINRGTLRLPRFLEPVHPMEPVLYRWLGVGLIKRIVATRIWPLLWGLEPPPKPKSRQELLDRTESMTKDSEAGHGTTFILVTFFALMFLVVGKYSEAACVLAFNLLLNGYPVMLQRVNRSRVRQIRASATRTA